VCPTSRTYWRGEQLPFPDGVEFLGDGDDGNVHFKVDIPIDDDGYFGRECPECEQHFRIALDDYDTLPDDLRLWCVYCGHDDDHSEFLTQQQRDRVMRAAGDYAMQVVGQTLDHSFGQAAHRSHGTLTYRSEPFYPSPLPGINEAADPRAQLRHLPAPLRRFRRPPVLPHLRPAAAAGHRH